MVKKELLFFLCCSMLLACNNNTDDATGDQPKVTSATKHSKTDSLQQTNNCPYLKFENDSVIVMPFKLKVDLSSKAKEKLARGHETIIINAYLTGTPTDSSLFAEDGQFYVASVEKEIAVGRVAKFDDIKFSLKVFNELVNKNLYLSAYAYSGRKSSPDNLLNCSIISDSISNVVGRELSLSCKLIYGDR